MAPLAMSLPAKLSEKGGYAVDVRRVDADAEDLVLSQTLSLLNRVKGSLDT